MLPSAFQHLEARQIFIKEQQPRGRRHIFTSYSPNELNPAANFLKQWLQIVLAFPRRAGLHIPVIHGRQSVRIFFEGHSKEIREECWAVTTCHCLLRSRFASPERCQTTVKKPGRKRFTGLGFERAGLGNFCGSGGEERVSVSPQEQHGHWGCQSSAVPTELRRGQRNGWREAQERRMYPQPCFQLSPHHCRENHRKRKKKNQNKSLFC